MNDALKPGLMPVDGDAWFRQLNLSNFVNTYYQYRDLQKLGDARKLLIVGPGQGLDTAVLRWRGFEVTTLDVDETFQPDVIGSVHDMYQFGTGQFDVVIASHVIEHLPVQYLRRALAELSRVGRSALIYLPVAGRHGLLKFVAGVRDLEFSWIWDLFNYWRRPDGVTAAFCEGQHYWEIGRRGYRVRDVRVMLQEFFAVVDEYRNRDWLPSYNFVLRSRHDSGQ